jgi:hypothetical protein
MGCVRLTGDPVFRRCLTVLLIASYLATSLARGPHAHASQPSDHGAHPHVHLDWMARLFGSVAGHVKDQDYEDQHHGYHHHHHDDHHPADGHGHTHSAPHGLPDQIPEPIPNGDQNHDSTCVYVADDPHVTGPSKSVSEDIRAIAQIVVFDVIVENIAVPMLLRPEWAHAPPDSLAAANDLFLKLRTLRI